MKNKTNDRRLLKGSAVGIAAIGLLVGGGTFALWYDSASVSDAEISSGKLTIDVVAPAVWTSGATAIDPATYLIVPGDVLTLSQPINITALGDNLTADLTVNATALAGSAALLAALAINFDITTPPTGIAESATPGVYAITGEFGTSTTPATLNAVVTITFPQSNNGAALDTVGRSNYWNLVGQGETIDLAAVNFDLVQTV